jgi:hypothetical protein
MHLPPIAISPTEIAIDAMCDAIGATEIAIGLRCDANGLSPSVLRFPRRHRASTYRQPRLPRSASSIVPTPRSGFIRTRSKRCALRCRPPRHTARRTRGRRRAGRDRTGADRPAARRFRYSRIPSRGPRHSRISAAGTLAARHHNTARCRIRSARSSCSRTGLRRQRLQPGRKVPIGCKRPSRAKTPPRATP